MSERAEDQAIVQGRRGSAAIVRIDPIVAEEALFRKLPQQILDDIKTEEVIAELSELKSGPEQVAAIVHIVMRQAVGTLLGQIIPPHTGAKIIKDRMVQTAVILLEILRENVDRIEREITKALKEGKDYEVKEKVLDLVQKHHASLIAIREIMNRFIVLYTINLPPPHRPPLAQVKLGMDLVVGPGGGE